MSQPKKKNSALGIVLSTAILLYGTYRLFNIFNQDAETPTYVIIVYSCFVAYGSVLLGSILYGKYVKK